MDVIKASTTRSKERDKEIGKETAQPGKRNRAVQKSRDKKRVNSERQKNDRFKD